MFYTTSIEYEASYDYNDAIKNSINLKVEWHRLLRVRFFAALALFFPIWCSINASSLVHFLNKFWSFPGYRVRKSSSNWNDNSFIIVMICIPQITIPIYSHHRSVTQDIDKHNETELDWNHEEVDVDDNCMLPTNVFGQHQMAR